MSVLNNWLDPFTRPARSNGIGTKDSRSHPATSVRFMWIAAP